MSVIADWMRVHHYFDDTLAALRRIAPEACRDRSVPLLDQLEHDLTLHMRHEEQVLMPAYERLAHEVPANGAPHVLAADHQRIRDLLHELRPLLGARRLPDVVAEQRVLCLLAGALEHHDHREHRWFVPVLDEGIAERVRRDWVRAFRADASPFRGPYPQPEAAPMVSFQGGPWDVLIATVGRDGDVPSAFEAVPVPPGRKGATMHQACVEQVRVLTGRQPLTDRRDTLARLAERVRLLAIIARHTPQ